MKGSSGGGQQDPSFFDALKVEEGVQGRLVALFFFVDDAVHALESCPAL